jgi:hypothetical protein
LAKKNKLSEKQKLFLEQYADTYNIAASCRFAKTSRPTYYKWLRESKEFEESKKSIDESYVDLSEAVLKHTLRYGYKTDKGGNTIMVPTGNKTNIPLLDEKGENVYDEHGEMVYTDELTYQYSKEAIDTAKFVLSRKAKERGYVESIDVNANIKAMQTKQMSKEEIIDVTPEKMKQMFLEEIKND